MIKLAPHQWARATWRPIHEAPGEPPPFDRKRAAAAIRAGLRPHWPRWWWVADPFGAALTPDEAGAWLRLMQDRTRKPGDRARDMLAYDGAIPSEDEAFALAAKAELPNGLELSALLTLVPAEAVAERVPGFSKGVRAFLLPRLLETDRERLAERIRAWLPTQTSADERWRAHPLAGELGLHDLVQEYVDSLPPRSRRTYTPSVFALGSAAAMHAAFTRLGEHFHYPHDVVAWLAHTEEARLEECVAQIATGPAKEERGDVFAALLRHADGPELARVLFEHRETKDIAVPAREWLHAHMIHTSAALAPQRDRPEVVTYLRARKRAGDGHAAELVPGDEGEARELPPSLRAALYAAPRKKIPAWVDVPMLPPLTVGGKRLGVHDVHYVVQLLMAGEPAPPELGNREAFGLALFEAWLEHDAPPAGRWALAALGSLGGDAAVERLAPMIRRWPSESHTPRATVGLGVLGDIGSDVALMHLSAIAARIKFPVLRARARGAMEQIAAAKGLTTAELEDRIVPVFDADTPKKQVTEATKIQAARLEQAMVTQRRWSAEDFERFIVRHPFQGQLARQLLWRCGSTVFRVSGELDYADASDSPVGLDGEVRLAHPLQMTDVELIHWGELIADYGMLPPFPQLSRPVHPPPAQPVLSFKERIGAGTLVRVLESRGWLRGPVGDAAIFDLHTKPFETVIAVIEYQPGIQVTRYADVEDQTMSRVYLQDGAPWSIDPIVASEVMVDVHAVLEKAR